MPTTGPESGGQLPPRLHVAVGLLVARHQVLIQERIPGTPHGGLWEFPGGKILSNEKPWEALVRELDEELGIEVRGGAPLFITDHDYPDRYVTLNFWSVTRWAGRPFGREGQQVAWVGVDQLGDYPFLEGNRRILQNVIRQIA